MCELTVPADGDLGDHVEQEPLTAAEIVSAHRSAQVLRYERTPRGVGEYFEGVGRGRGAGRGGGIQGKRMRGALDQGILGHHERVEHQEGRDCTIIATTASIAFRCGDLVDSLQLSTICSPCDLSRLTCSHLIQRSWMQWLPADAFCVEKQLQVCVSRCVIVQQES